MKLPFEYPFSKIIKITETLEKEELLNNYLRNETLENITLEYVRTESKSLLGVILIDFNFWVNAIKFDKTTEKILILSNRINDRESLYDFIEKARQIEIQETFSSHKMENKSLIEFSIEYDKFKDDEFDIIFCNHVLEHIPDDTKAMQELYRVLKKGGMGVFQIPQDLKREITFEDNSITDKNERAKIFGQYDHVRVYGRDYFDKLRRIGFKVDEVDYTSQLSDEGIQTYCLAKGEIIPVVYKN